MDAALEAAVLAAIEANEGPDESGGYGCSNDSVVDATGLTPGIVAEVLRGLWKQHQIEGILTMGGVRPSLVGIRRVVAGRPRVWGDSGYYQPQPG